MENNIIPFMFLSEDQKNLVRRSKYKITFLNMWGKWQNLDPTVDDIRENGIYRVKVDDIFYINIHPGGDIALHTDKAKALMFRQDGTTTFKVLEEVLQ